MEKIPRISSYSRSSADCLFLPIYLYISLDISKSIPLSLYNNLGVFIHDNRCLNGSGGGVYLINVTSSKLYDYQASCKLIQFMLFIGPIEITHIDVYVYISISISCRLSIMRHQFREVGFTQRVQSSSFLIVPYPTIHWWIIPKPKDEEVEVITLLISNPVDLILYINNIYLYIRLRILMT